MLRVHYSSRPPSADRRGAWVVPDPAGGTLPRPAAACRRLRALARPFAPVPKDAACTQIYGGPQVARVTGTFEQQRVWVRFKRTDGCEIARWNRVRFLFAGAGTG